MTDVNDNNGEQGVRTFFDKLAEDWSRTHYGPQGGMVGRIARFAGALDCLAPAPAAILDYGCGTGDIAVALAARGYRVEGRDTSPAMIDQARALHAGANVEFAVVAPIESGATTLGTDFDAIVCSSVLEYVDDLTAILHAFAVALRPGGWLLATVPNVDHPLRRGEAWHRMLMNSRFARAVIRFTPMAESFELQWLSRNRFPMSEWAALVEGAGFKPVWQDCEDHPLTLLIGQRRH